MNCSYHTTGDYMCYNSNVIEKFAEDISKSEKVYNEYLMQIEELKKKEEEKKKAL